MITQTKTYGIETFIMEGEDFYKLELVLNKKMEDADKKDLIEVIKSLSQELITFLTNDTNG